MAVLTATVEDFTAVGAVAADRSVLMFRTDRFDAATGLSARQWHAEVVGGVLSTQLPDMSPGVSLRISASSSIPGFKSVAVAGYPASITLSELLTATNPDGSLKYVVDPTTLEPMRPLPASAAEILVQAAQARDDAQAVAAGIPAAAEVAIAAEAEAQLAPLVADAAAQADSAAASKVQAASSASSAGTSAFDAGTAAAKAQGAANEAVQPVKDTVETGRLSEKALGGKFSLPTTVEMSRRFGPQFAAKAGAVVTHAATGLASIYFPWVIKVKGKIANPLGDYYMLYSTDHDTNGGGIGLAYANDPAGPWTVHKPGGNPIIYKDTVAGDQTETAAVLHVPTDPDGKPFYFYYQQQGVGVNQSTLLAKTADFVTFTRIGIVIQGSPTRAGDGQSTYFRPMLWGDLYVGFHLMGGGDYGMVGMSVSRDGINWVTHPHRIGYATDDIGSSTGRIMPKHLFQWRGQDWGLYGQEPYSSGFSGGPTRKFLTARVAPDGRRHLGKPQDVLSPFPVGVTEVDLGASVIEHEGNLYMFYRANGPYGDIRVAIAGA